MSTLTFRTRSPCARATTGHAAAPSPAMNSRLYWPPLVPMGQWPEITCTENANGYDGRNPAKKAPMPIADKPDF
jgi:hypothetical protein